MIKTRKKIIAFQNSNVTPPADDAKRLHAADCPRERKRSMRKLFYFGVPHRPVPDDSFRFFKNVYKQLLRFGTDIENIFIISDGAHGAYRHFHVFSEVKFF